MLCLVCEVVCRYVLRWQYPYNYPAVPPTAIFGDFRFWIAKFLAFHSRNFYAGSSLMYPAPVSVVYKLFLLEPHSHVFATMRFICVILVASWLLLAGFRRGLIRRGLEPRAASAFVAAVYLLSFPFWFEIHQANMEFVVWLLVSGAIWAFWTSRPSVAMVCIGLAGAMKIFPFVFLGIFLLRRQYRYIAGALVIAGAATILSLWLVCPDIAYSYRETAAGLDTFRLQHVLQLLQIEGGFDHSLFALIKRMMSSIPPPAQMSRIANTYLLCAAAAGCVLFFTRIRKLPFVNQVLCLSIASILLPPTSYDYTLLHLYAPFALLSFVVVERAARSMPDPSPMPFLLAFSLFAFLFSAQSEFIIHGARFAGQLKALCLLLLWLVALRYPFVHAEEAELQY
jgi:hypothetical protein